MFCVEVCVFISWVPYACAAMAEVHIGRGGFARVHMVMETSRSLKFTFSNSLIIHQEETKKITAVTMVWIYVPYFFL